MKQLTKNLLHVFLYVILFTLNALPLKAMEQIIALDPDAIIANKELTPELKTQALLAQATNNVCPVCGYKADCRSILKRHLRIHTGERPFICDFPGCKADFAQSSQLIEHKKRHRGDYTCKICKESFITSDELTSHKTTHKGEKRYICDFPGCNAAFARNSNLTAHKQLHTGDKPYRCDTCGKYFALRCALNNHKHIHSDERPFICSECGLAFKQSSHLSTHKKRLPKRDLPLPENKEETIKKHRLEEHEVLPIIGATPEVESIMHQYNPIDTPLFEAPLFEAPEVEQDLSSDSLEDLYPILQ